ncbi:TadE family type IV pilus minor pilin [Prauserella muralis]|uniref:Uncharacterized protein n=1 Tax=Prauserella muralis TaxID=588067 RepID=A0A2V4B7I3_9PSEU|nr:TadE family type IV pilus minor pilin [Prauserella muralis]PXY31197.1 hypothetical protein BAY60_01950 [Prauserella muralis]TWE14505.1 hypothetical protein FHX69_6656 [Prauserella muralis]
MAASPVPSPAAADRGSVTVEGALALCSLVVVFAFVLAGTAAVTGQLRCTDAAREAARLIARGQPALAAEAVRTLAPSGATLDVRGQGRTVAVTVRADPAGGLLPGVTVVASAHAELEPGVAGVSRDEPAEVGAGAPR